MPRPKITTTFTGRVKPTTNYKKPRNRTESPVSFDSVEITFDSTQYTWDMTFEDLGILETLYKTPRSGLFLRDINQENVFDLSWEQVLWISGRRENRIITKYT